MKNKDYLYLLTKGDKKKPKYRTSMNDYPNMDINQARILQRINQEISEMADEYIGTPNTDATRDALAISIQRMLNQYRDERLVDDACVSDVQVHPDGTATVNISYQPTYPPDNPVFRINI